LAGGLNLYGFAGGDPINFADPYGLATDSIILESEEAKTLFDRTTRILKLAADREDRHNRRNVELLMDEIEKVRASDTDHLTVGIGECERGGFGCYDPDKGTLRVDVEYIRKASWSTRRPVTTAAHELGHFLDHRRFFGASDEAVAMSIEATLRRSLGMGPPGAPIRPSGTYHSLEGQPSVVP